jgi:Xaa-Pro aminopeptidase
MRSAELIIDTTEKNVDLYYATGFTAPDSYIYFKIGGKKYVMMNDLEIDRARKNAKVNSVLSFSEYANKAAKTCKDPGQIDVVITALKEKKIKKLVVPESMSFTTVDYLRKKGFKIEAGPTPFYLGRLQKDKAQMTHVLDSQRAVFSAMKLAEDMIRKSKIKKNALYLNGKPLTSEIVRDAIQLRLYEKGCVVTDGTIVACGNDTIDPHNFGSGILKPHKAIIVDIFPKSMKTLYFGDSTRTFCKGKAPAELKKMYKVVKTAQTEAIKKIKAGVNGKKIHEGIVNYFDDCGYPTGEMGGRMQGFFHSTGHGIGLELHEAPLRIGPIDYKLKEGFIASVEPGLYYKKVGGVRIEDLVYVTKKGCEVLGRYPKKLEIM